MAQRMRWAKDQMATDPPSKTMGPNDRASLTFVASVAINAADVEVFIVQADQSLLPVESGIEASFQVASPHVTVLLGGLSLGTIYKVAVTFVVGTAPADHRWTRVLTVPCRL